MVWQGLGRLWVGEEGTDKRGRGRCRGKRKGKNHFRDAHFDIAVYGKRSCQNSIGSAASRWMHDQNETTVVTEPGRSSTIIIRRKGPEGHDVKRVLGG